MPPDRATSALAPARRATLHLLCRTFLPALEPHLGDEAALFAASADTLGILPQVERALAALPAAQFKETVWFLWLLEQPAFSAVLIGKAIGFSKLPFGDRERVLLALARSRSARLRKAFQGLKRLSCFLFYSTHNAHGNPVWPNVGYSPSPNAPTDAPRLAIETPQSDTLDGDVCIVGSGAGGGVMAAELATSGRKVIVLEAAAPLQSSDFDQRELAGMQSLYLEQGLLATRDLAVTILAGSALGGGTAVNWQTSFRTPADVRAEWAEHSGCGFFTESSFDASLDAVLRRLWVGTGESVINPNNDALRRGCEALGYKWSVIPRNAHGCDPAQCGYCMYGCRMGGKQSTTVSYLRDAQQSGNTTIVGNCRAERVLIERGEVTGVQATYTEPNGAARSIIVRARTVVAAAGGIESPALLLRSGIGLPALGRHLFLHPVSGAVGIYPQPIRAWDGPPQTVVCDEFATIAGGYGFRLETTPAHPGLGGLATPWHGARAHRELMQAFDHAGVIIVLTRDHTGGRVWVNRAGRTQIDYSVGARELHYLNTGIAAAARIHAAAGADAVYGLHSRPVEWHRPADINEFRALLARTPLAENWSPIFSAHQMGTCRMGRGPDAAVCNETGEVYGVRGLFIGDASAFPGSCGVNPMITIMALAHHTAQCIKARI